MKAKKNQGRFGTAHTTKRLNKWDAQTLDSKPNSLSYGKTFLVLLETVDGFRDFLFMRVFDYNDDSL